MAISREILEEQFKKETKVEEDVIDDIEDDEVSTELTSPAAPVTSPQGGTELASPAAPVTSPQGGTRASLAQEADALLYNNTMAYKWAHYAANRASALWETFGKNQSFDQQSLKGTQYENYSHLFKNVDTLYQAEVTKKDIDTVVSRGRILEDMNKEHGDTVNLLRGMGYGLVGGLADASLVSVLGGAILGSTALLTAPLSLPVVGLVAGASALLSAPVLGFVAASSAFIGAEIGTNFATNPLYTERQAKEEALAMAAFSGTLYGVGKGAKAIYKHLGAKKKTSGNSFYSDLANQHKKKVAMELYDDLTQKDGIELIKRGIIKPDEEFKQPNVFNYDTKPLPKPSLTAMKEFLDKEKDIAEITGIPAPTTNIIPREALGALALENYININFPPPNLPVTDRQLKHMVMELFGERTNTAMNSLYGMTPQQLQNFVGNDRYKIAGQFSEPIIEAASLSSSPAVRTMFSRAETVRNIGASLFNPIYKTEGNKRGVETVFSASADYSFYKQHLVQDLDNALSKTQKTSGLKRPEISALLTEAMHSDDKHSNPHIESLAKETRFILDNVGKKAEEVGAIDQFMPFKKGTSYAPRQFSKTAVMYDKKGFIDTLQKEIDDTVAWIRNESLYMKIDKIADYDKEFHKKHNITHEGQQVHLTGMEAVNKKRELAGLKPLPNPEGMRALDIYDTITRDSFISAQQAMDSVHERTLWFVDSATVMDFLNKDAISVINDWFDRTSRSIVLAERFGTINSLTENPNIARLIRAEYEILGYNESQVNKLVKNDMRDLEAMFQMVRGMYNAGNPVSKIVQISRAGRAVVNVQKLGMAGLASIGDLLMPMKHVGVINYVGDSLKALIRKIPFIKKSTAVRDLVGALNIEKARFAMEGLRTGELYQTQRRSIPEMIWDKAKNAIHILNMTNKIEEWVMSVGSSYSYNHMMRLFAKKTLTTKEVAYLASLGLSKQTINELSHVVKTTATKEYGTTIAQFTKAQEKVLGKAITVAARNLSLNPQQQELPLWYHHEAGKVLAMYKGYLVSCHNRISMSSLLERDANHLFMILAMIGVAALSLQTRKILNNKPIEEDMSKLAYDAVLEAGVFGFAGLPMDAYHELFADDDGKNKRSSSVSLSRQIPVAQSMEDVVKVMQAAKRGGKWTRAEKRALKRTAIYNNIAGVGYVWNSYIDDN